jgi:hypothetical protein
MRMENTRRPPRQQAQPLRDPAEGAAQVAGTSHIKSNAYVIRASRTKHGPRPEWGQRQYAQAAIANRWPDGIPTGVIHSELHRWVKDWLSKNPDYCAAPRGPLTRPTVIRALRDLREANRG